MSTGEALYWFVGGTAFGVVLTCYVLLVTIELARRKGA